MANKNQNNLIIIIPTFHKLHLKLYSTIGDKINTLVSHDMEQVDILNMKRGILSTLQVDKDAELETDVNGLCKPEVTMEGDKIVKTKKLSECYKRAQNIYGIQSASFKTESSLKPLNSNSKCTYTMDGETIKNVVCEESHLFRPFSAGYETPSGAMTIVKQTMKFVTGQNAPVSSVKVESEYNFPFEIRIHLKSTHTVFESLKNFGLSDLIPSSKPQ